MRIVTQSDTCWAHGSSAHKMRMSTVKDSQPAPTPVDANGEPLKQRHSFEQIHCRSLQGIHCPLFAPWRNKTLGPFTIKAKDSRSLKQEWDRCDLETWKAPISKHSVSQFDSLNSSVLIPQKLHARYRYCTNCKVGGHGQRPDWEFDADFLMK